MSRVRDELLMRRALELARRAHGTTWPNPMVGAVVERDGRILGEGHHRVAGGPHAEVEALHDCGEDPAGATMIVTLEPCSHVNRTGPCTDAVLRAGIGRVVIGTLDPNPVVAGNGARELREAGLAVTVGVLARECTELNEVYFTSRTAGRPHVTLKSATDLFGRTATRAGESQWITGEQGRAHAHRWRARTPAIAVGAGTALDDDPRLTARPPGGAAGPSPTRVLFDSRRRVAADARMFADDGVPVVVYTTEAGAAQPQAGPAPSHVEVVPCGPGPRVDLARALDDLARREVIGLLVEGGATLAGAFVDAGLFDTVVRYLAARVIGGDEAPGVLTGRGVAALLDTPVLEFVGVELLGSDVVLTARRPLEIPCSQG